jgi:hypothetical protein
LSEDGVEEAEVGGVEGVSVFEGFFVVEPWGLADGSEWSVVFIAEDWVSELGEVDADLVISACVECAVDAGVAMPAFDDGDFGACGPGVEGFGFGRHEDAVSAGVASDGEVDDVGFEVGRAVDESGVGFGDPGLLEIDGEESVCEVFLGGDDETAGHAIESVNDAWSEESGEVGLFVEVPLEDIGECVLLEVTDGVGDESGGFVDDDDPGIFVDDCDGLFGWGWFEEFVGWFGESDADGLAGEDAIGGISGLIIDGGESGGDESVESPGGVVAEVSGEEGIDP